MTLKSFDFESRMTFHCRASRWNLRKTQQRFKPRYETQPKPITDTNQPDITEKNPVDAKLPSTQMAAI